MASFFLEKEGTYLHFDGHIEKKKSQEACRPCNQGAGASGNAWMESDEVGIIMSVSSMIVADWGCSEMTFRPRD
jgi:hypothetical protein